MLDRDDPEATAAILLLDRELLRTRYKLVPYHDPMVGDLLGYYEASDAKEAEEMIEVDVMVDLKRYLLGVIWLQEDEMYPRRLRSRSLPRHRSRAP